eukprot:767296-Amphidinium_carterae.4
MFLPVSAGELRQYIGWSRRKGLPNLQSRALAGGGAGRGLSWSSSISRSTASTRALELPPRPTEGWEGTGGGEGTDQVTSKGQATKEKVTRSLQLRQAIGEEVAFLLDAQEGLTARRLARRSVRSLRSEGMSVQASSKGMGRKCSLGEGGSSAANQSTVSSNRRLYAWEVPSHTQDPKGTVAPAVCIAL